MVWLAKKKLVQRAERDNDGRSRKGSITAGETAQSDSDSSPTRTNSISFLSSKKENANKSQIRKLVKPVEFQWVDMVLEFPKDPMCFVEH